MNVKDEGYSERKFSVKIGCSKTDGDVAVSNFSKLGFMVTSSELYLIRSYQDG